MPDKEKNTLHPFAGYLQSGEVLLWCYSPKPRPLRWNRGRAMLIANRNGCFPFIGRVFKRLGFPLHHQYAPAFMAYGVTNLRLLRRRNNIIASEPLNECRIPIRIIYQGTRATLYLGRTSWWWTDIEAREAERVIQIIEQAKAQFKSLS